MILLKKCEELKNLNSILTADRTRLTEEMAALKLNVALNENQVSPKEIKNGSVSNEELRLLKKELARFKNMHNQL